MVKKVLIYSIFFKFNLYFFMTKYALITGGTSGIGLNIALELAKRNYNLIIVGRTLEHMQEAKNRFSSEYKNLEIIYEQVDLANKNETENLANKYLNNVEILVNNAGYGKWKYFDELNYELDIYPMITVDILAPLYLTSKLIPSLHINNGYLMNISSEVAYNFIPKFSIYGPNKAFILHFSETIRREFELQNKNISVTTVLPTTTDTNFFDKAEFTEEEKQNLFNKIQKPVSAQDLAINAVKAMFDKKPIYVDTNIQKAKLLSTKLMNFEQVSALGKKLFTEQVE